MFFFSIQAAGVQKPCLMSEALENPIPGSTEDTVKWMTASLCGFCSCMFLFIAAGLMWAIDGGSVDTTAATTAGFLLNMILHPEIQKKAQAEIDRVVGLERLPTFAE